MLYLWDNGKLNFIPDSPRSMYDTQLRAMKDYKIVLEARAMKDYKIVLEARATIEGIELY